LLWTRAPRGMSRLEDELRVTFGEKLSMNRNLAEFTSIRIGGPADMMLVVDSQEELAAAMRAALRENIAVFCLGAGTNLIVSDRGVRGLVVRLGDGFAKFEIVGTHVSAGASVDFGKLVEAVVERGLEGLEFGEGIPGSVGGALIMNAGAFGGEIAPVVTAVHGVTAEGDKRVLSPSEIGFSYRRTNLPQRFVITKVEFELRHGDRDRLRERMLDVRAKRAARQPQGFPNAGSIFKNPPGKFAGRLLESVGLKGHRIGNAAFSDHHANFIVNLGAARADDVHALMELARERVRAQTGVILEPEVRLAGEW